MLEGDARAGHVEVGDRDAPGRRTGVESAGRAQDELVLRGVVEIARCERGADEEIVGGADRRHDRAQLEEASGAAQQHPHGADLREAQDRGARLRDGQVVDAVVVEVSDGEGASEFGAGGGRSRGQQTVGDLPDLGARGRHDERDGECPEAGEACEASHVVSSRTVPKSRRKWRSLASRDLGAESDSRRTPGLG